MVFTEVTIEIISAGHNEPELLISLHTSSSTGYEIMPFEFKHPAI